MPRANRPLSALLLATLLPIFLGCGPVPVRIKTAIRPDGSCDREVLQPTTEFLPRQAFEPDWERRWGSVEWRKSGQKLLPTVERSQAPFVFLKGSFANVAEIPDHYAYAGDRRTRDAVLAAGIPASVLRRAFQARDLGFLVEYSFTETITNPRDPVGAAAAAQELAALTSKWVLRYIDNDLARRYDVSALSAYARKNVRSFVLDLTLEMMRSPRLTGKLGSLSLAIQQVAPPRLRELGINAEPLERAEKLEELNTALEQAMNAMLRQLIRHPDGRPLTEEEVGHIDDYEPGSSSALGDRLDEMLRELVPPLVRIFGIYRELLLPPFFMGGVVFTCEVELPGQVIETNGRLMGGSAVRWRIGGEQLFGGDFTMSARSIVLERAIQKEALGRVPIHDLDSADQFLDLVGDSPAILDALGTVRAAKSLTPLERLSLPVGPEATRRERLLALLAGDEPRSE